MIEVDLLRERRGRRPRAEEVAASGRTRSFPRDGWMIGSTAVALAASTAAVLLVTAAGDDASGLAGRVETAFRDSVRLAAGLQNRRVLEVRRDSIAARVDLVLVLDAQRYVWPHLMDEVASALPREAWLTRLAQAPSAEGGVRLQIEGRALGNLALTRFWNRMENSPFIRSVRLISSERNEHPAPNDAEGLYDFVIEAEHETPDPELIEWVPMADTAAW